MDRLSSRQVTQELADFSKWKLVDEKWIERSFHFKKYLAGIHFVNQIAEYAENKQHHPLMSINYKNVSVKFSSWQEQGLTTLDFEMAKHVDALYEQGEGK